MSIQNNPYSDTIQRSYQDIVRAYLEHLDATEDSVSPPLDTWSGFFSGSSLHDYSYYKQHGTAFKFADISSTTRLIDALDLMSQILTPNLTDGIRYMGDLDFVKDPSFLRGLSDRNQKFLVLQKLVNSYFRIQASFEGSQPQHFSYDTYRAETHLFEWITLIDPEEEQLRHFNIDPQLELGGSEEAQTIEQLEKLRKSISYLLLAFYQEEYLNNPDVSVPAYKKEMTGRVTKADIEIRNEWIAGSIALLTALLVGVGEAAVAAAPFIALLAAYPWLIPIVVTAVFITAFIINYVLVYEDTKDMMLMILEGRLFKYKNGNEDVSLKKKLLMSLFGMFSIGAGFSYAALSFSSLQAVLLLLGFTGLSAASLGALPAIATFIGFTSMFCVSIMLFIRDDGMQAVVDYFASWKIKLQQEGWRAALSFCTLEIIKIIVSLSVIGIIGTVSYGVFLHKGFALAKCVMNANVAWIIAHLFTAMAELVCFGLFGFQKVNQQVFALAASLGDLFNRGNELRSWRPNPIQERANRYGAVCYTLGIICLVGNTLGQVVLFAKDVGRGLSPALRIVFTALTAIAEAFFSASPNNAALTRACETISSSLFGIFASRAVEQQQVPAILSSPSPSTASAG